QQVVDLLDLGLVGGQGAGFAVDAIELARHEGIETARHAGHAHAAAGRLPGEHHDFAVVAGRIDIADVVADRVVSDAGGIEATQADGKNAHWSVSVVSNAGYRHAAAKLETIARRERSCQT